MRDPRTGIYCGQSDPGSLAPNPLSCSRNSHANLSAGRHGVDAVAQEIGDELPNLIGYRINLGVIPDLSLDIDSFIPGPGGKERNELVSNWSQSDGLGLLRFSVEPQALLRQVRDTRKLTFCSGKKFAHIVANGFVLGQVNEVGDGFQRIVEFARDGGPPAGQQMRVVHSCAARAQPFCAD